MKVRVILKYFVNISGNNFFLSKSAQTPSNLIPLTILATLRAFSQFYIKIRAIKLQKKSAKTFSLSVCVCLFPSTVKASPD